MSKNYGFTLVEIAIVLVIIGLLLGGILKGQELINNAKVRAMADRQNSLKIAWFSFFDRFQGLPGDYMQADIYITGASAGNGDGEIEVTESPMVFQHLTSAGFLRCPHCTETATDSHPHATNSLINVYGGVMSIQHNDAEYAVRVDDPDNHSAYKRLLITTGANIPSNIISEVDRKIDDGMANTGDFVFNEYFPKGFQGGIVNRPDASACMKSDPEGLKAAKGLYTKIPLYWRPANAQPPIEQNCAGSVYL